jgi:hypothetical protein
LTAQSIVQQMPPSTTQAEALGYVEAPSMTVVVPGSEDVCSDHNGAGRLKMTTTTMTTPTTNNNNKTALLLGDQEEEEDHKNSNRWHAKCWIATLVGVLTTLSIVVLLLVVHKNHGTNSQQQRSQQTSNEYGSSYNRTNSTTGNSYYNNRHNSGYWGWWGNSRSSGNSNSGSNSGSSRYHSSSGSSSYHSSGSGYHSYSGSCFPAGELVELLLEVNHEHEHDNVSSRIVIQRIPIEQVRPGNITVGGGKVTAVMKLLFVAPASKSLDDNGSSATGSTRGDTMYRYNDSVCVTGSHAVPIPVNINTNTDTTNKTWQLQRVRDSPLAVAVEQDTISTNDDPHPCGGGRPEFVYNLVTERHLLSIDGTVLADWEETDLPLDAVASQAILLHRLNHYNSTNITNTNTPLLSATTTITERERELLPDDTNTTGTTHDNHTMHVQPSTVVGVGVGAFAPDTLVDVLVDVDVRRQAAQAQHNGDNTKTSLFNKPTHVVRINIQDIEPGTVLADDYGSIVVARVTIKMPECERELHCHCRHDSDISEKSQISQSTVSASNKDDAHLWLWRFTNHNNHTITTSPWTIVKDPSYNDNADADSVWRHVKDSPRSEPVVRNTNETKSDCACECDCLMYQLITSTHQIPIAGTLFADYELQGST